MRRKQRRSSSRPGRTSSTSAPSAGAYESLSRQPRPVRRIVGLGDVQQGKFAQGQWRVVRQLGGDDTGQGEILTVRPNAPLRVTVYHYE
jgi:hypothetical protein